MQKRRIQLLLAFTTVLGLPIHSVGAPATVPLTDSQWESLWLHSPRTSGIGRSVALPVESAGREPTVAVKTLPTALPARSSDAAVLAIAPQLLPSQVAVVTTQTAQTLAASVATASVQAPLIVLGRTPPEPSPAAIAADTSAPLMAGSAGVPSSGHTEVWWLIAKGQKLSVALIEWGRRAKVDISWDAPDYRATETIKMHGSFDNALLKLLEGANRDGIFLRAKDYSGDGYRKIRIIEKS
jgi:hypothetical protein